MTFTAKALRATFDSGRVGKRGKSYKSCGRFAFNLWSRVNAKRFRQIGTCLRTLLVLILLLSGLQTAPVRAGLPSDFRPASETISGLVTPTPQALPPAQGAKPSNPDRQIVVPGSGAAYDIPPQIFLPDNGAFERNLRLRLPASCMVATAVRTGHSPRAPPYA